MEWNANSLCFLSECLTNSNRNSPWEIENHPLLQIKWLEFIVYISKWLKRVAVEHDYESDMIPDVTRYGYFQVVHMTDQIFFKLFFSPQKKCGFATCNRLKLLNGATFVALSFIPGFQLLDENYIVYQEMHLVAPNCININFSRVNLIERRMCHWKIFASKVKYKTNSYLPGPANCHPRAELAEVVQSTLSEENFRQDCYQSSSSPASPEKQERHHRHQYFSRSSTWFHVIWTKLSNSIYDSLAL